MVENTINAMTLLFNSKDTRMQSIISKCASLHETYKPPWWCFGPWMNVFVTLIKEKFAPSLRFEREVIVCEDGGKLFKVCHLKLLYLKKAVKNLMDYKF